MNMRYDFLNIADRSEVSASKTDADFVKGYLGVNYYEDTIPMWVADMDFVVAPEIVEAIKRRAEMATFGYSGFSEGYYGALISWFKRRHGAVFSSADVVYNNGTVSATRNIIRAFTK